MKKVVAALIAGCALAAAGPGQAANPNARRIATLEKQVKTLTKQVKALRKDVDHANREVLINYVGDACQSAIVTDTFRGTWNIIDQLSAATQAGGKTYFGAQTTVNDKNACHDINVTRAETQVPPPLSVFVTLIDFLI